jgi:predicted nucleotidyltransferase
MLMLTHDADIRYSGWHLSASLFVAPEKLPHLTAYYSPADTASFTSVISKCMHLFDNDAKEICAAEGLRYDSQAAGQIMDYFEKHVKAKGTMNPSFKPTFEKIVAMMEQNEHCSGCWFFGSSGRGEDDEFSDYDIVFLAENEHYGKLKADILRTVYAVCDEIVAVRESGMGRHMRYWGYAVVVRTGGDLHLLDLAVINYAYRDDPIGMDFCRNCDAGNVIFDKDGKVAEMLSRPLDLDFLKPDGYEKTIEKHWNQALASVKHFKRGNTLRLLRQMTMLFYSHVDLLRLRYDDYLRGSWCDGVRYKVPVEKQELLKLYFTPPDVMAIKAAFWQCLAHFDSEAKEACLEMGVAYPNYAAERITAYLKQELSDLLL